jgi:hypothetical protein
VRLIDWEGGVFFSSLLVFFSFPFRALLFILKSFPEKIPTKTKKNQQKK